jgi:hypothetical protein
LQSRLFELGSPTRAHDGVALPDPAGRLQGAGKYMRHVKVKPGLSLDRLSLEALITAAYRDIVARLGAEE